MADYEEYKKDSKPFQIDNQTDGCVYDVKDLDKGPSFIARPGDVYILDVSKVHSVIPLGEEKVKRKAFCLSSSELNFNAGMWTFSPNPRPAIAIPIDFLVVDSFIVMFVI